MRKTMLVFFVCILCSCSTDPGNSTPDTMLDQGSLDLVPISDSGTDGVSEDVLDSGGPDLPAVEDLAADLAPEDVALPDLSSEGAPDASTDNYTVLPDVQTTDVGQGPCDFTGPQPDWVGIPGAGYSFFLECQPRDVLLDFVDPAILRVRYVQPGEPKHSYAVLPQPFTDILMEYGSIDGSLVICAAHFRVQVEPGTCRLTIQDDEGNVLVEDLDSGGYQEETKLLDGQSVDTRSVSRKSPPEERFYGFGEKTGPLNKRGRKMVFWNTDYPSYPLDHDPMYQSIPFFIGFNAGRAYGVLTDNSYRLEMDMAALDPQQYAITAHGGEIDQYIVAGPGIDEVLERYSRLTGRPTLQPRWTLGYHQCRWSYYPDTQVLDICQKFRDREIPADGIWLDIDYMDDYRSWTWDPVGFPDPQGFVEQVEDLGFKVTAIIDPGLKLDTEWDIYKSGVAGGHFISQDETPYAGVVWPGPSVFPDFTNPDTRAWWGTLIDALTGPGVRGIWLDMNEPASFVAEQNWTLPNHLETDFDGTGSTMAESHNVYALAENQATYEGLLSAVPNSRPFLLTRAGYAGIQRYAAVWTGDAASNFPALQDQLPMLLGLGLSGVPMVGSDVGGWEGDPGAQLFARWIQLGAISPFYRAHVQTGTPDQEPWSYTLEVEEISRLVINHRYRLLPYFYSLLRQATLTGAPMLRPLVYEFPEDPQTWDLSYEAMLGPWLLYAPVLTEDAETLDIYLPEGRWLEYHSGALYEGPSTIATGLQLQALPVYLREGAIVPKAQLMMYSDQQPVDPLTLELFPGPAPSSFTLYEDDGESLNHQQGSYSAVTYTLQQTPGGAYLKASPREGTFAPPPRRLVLRVRPIDGAVASVGLSSVPLPPLGSANDFAAASSGWFHDQNDRSLWVVFSDQVDFQVEFQYQTAVTMPGPDVLVPMRVVVPEGTPEDAPIHIATSAADWSQQPLQWSADKLSALGEIPVPRGQWFEYKYTRGGWDSVEKWEGCKEAENRYHLGKALPLKQDSVTQWADLCQ